MPPLLPGLTDHCFCDPDPKTNFFSDYCCILDPGDELQLCEKNVSPPDIPYYIPFKLDIDSFLNGILSLAQ